MRLLQSETAPHLGPAGGLSFHPWKKAIFSLRQAISLSETGEKKEDGPRRDPLAKPGERQGFLCCYGVVTRTAKKCDALKVEKKSEGFFGVRGFLAPEEKIAGGKKLA